MAVHAGNFLSLKRYGLLSTTIPIGSKTTSDWWKKSVAP